MSVYYVSHPELQMTAKVNAPSTDKARTTFLDYLERTGSVSRRYRQAVRKAMATKRLVSPEETYADIELDYEYGDLEQAPQFITQPVMEELPSPEPLPEQGPPEQPITTGPAFNPTKTKIASVALGSFGVR